MFTIVKRSIPFYIYAFLLSWGPNRKLLRPYFTSKSKSKFHVIITSYQLVVSDVDFFKRIKWQYMILNEAQAIKSSASERWKVLLDFQCRNRLLLTGTPIQNTYESLKKCIKILLKKIECKNSGLSSISSCQPYSTPTPNSPIGFPKTLNHIPKAYLKSIHIN